MLKKQYTHPIFSIIEPTIDLVFSSGFLVSCGTAMLSFPSPD